MPCGVQFCTGWCVLLDEMSPYTPPRPASRPPLDAEEEARELEAFLRAQDPVDLAAADWHMLWEQGLDAEGERQLQGWLAEAPAHAAAFARLDRSATDLHAIAADLRRAGAMAVPVLAAEPPRAGRPRFSGWQFAGWRAWRPRLPRPAWVALCGMVLLVLGHGWWQLPGFEQDYAVARGQRQNVALPDGSVMHLDAQSRSRVSLYRDRREVHLAEGQAMFSVTPDRDRPFQVLAGSARVTVVGTRFSVRVEPLGADAGTVRVAVEEGQVQVQGRPVLAGHARTETADLRAGQAVVVAADGGVSAVAAVSPENIAPWRQGMLRFDSTPLAAVLQEMERYGPTGLVLDDPALGALPVGGSYRIGRVDEFASVLPRILPVRLAAGADGKTRILGAADR